MKAKITKRTSKKNLLFESIRSLIESARNIVVRQTNSTMVFTYFEIGKSIVKYEQDGKARAEYAHETLKNLSEKLSDEFGKSFSVRNLEQMRKFYLLYHQKISQTLSAKSLKSKPVKGLQIPQTVSAEFNLNISASVFPLSWSHYVILSRITNNDERSFYEIESVQNNWSLAELNRQFETSVYERLVLSRNKKRVKELAVKGQVMERPEDAIKHPLILEFLGLKEESYYNENDLETAIISQIERFMLEMGKGFLFSGRQVRFTFDEENFYVDLVFYNRLLRCFVLVDLKLGKLKHQDLGQMQMYVSYYDRHVKSTEENNTIGIIICKDKKDARIEITLPKENKQIFAGQYQSYLPSKKDLKKMIQSN